MTVEPILLVFMFAQFLSYPVYQHLLYKIVCAESPSCNESFRNANETVCSNFNESSVEQEVQKQTSYWILYTNLAMGVPSILLSIFYGSVSDQLGRKLFIFLPALGAVMNTGVMLEVAYLPDQLPKYLFLIGAFASGLYGSYSVLNSTAYSYVADVTARSGRTRQIGLLESMTYLGATLSLLVGGIWISRDPSTVSIFWCILACQLAVMLYTVVALPESMYFSGQRSEDRTQMSTYTRKFSQAHKFSRACTRFLLAIHHNISGFCKLLLTNWRVSVLLLAFTVVEINFLGITDVVFLYAMGRPLCWGTSTVGYFLALKVFCNGLAALFILPVMLALQLSDTVITMVGLVSGGLGLLIMGVADRTWIMFLGMYVCVVFLGMYVCVVFLGMYVCVVFLGMYVCVVFLGMYVCVVFLGMYVCVVFLGMYVCVVFLGMYVCVVFLGMYVCVVFLGMYVCVVLWCQCTGSPSCHLVLFTAFTFTCVFKIFSTTCVNCYYYPLRAHEWYCTQWGVSMCLV